MATAFLVMTSQRYWGYHMSKFNKQKTIDNLHSKGGLYYYDGIEYRGSYHIHKETGQAMTGATHTKDSVNLQVKKIKG